MPSNVVPLVFGLVVFALAAFSPGILNDGDSFTHIAAGGWMLDHHAVIRNDPFSFSFAGAPWVSHEWLAEILMALAYRGAGWAGVMALTGGAAALAFLNLGRHVARFVPAGPVALMLGLGLMCSAGTLLARPHILALPVMEAWVAGLVMARAGGRAPSWWLLPLMVLWANLHGGFAIGLALCVPLAAEAVQAAPRPGPVARHWAGFLLAAVAAAALTPHGVPGLLLPFRLTGMAQLAGINEWAPTNFATLQPIEIVLVAGLYVALSRGAVLPPWRILVLVGLLHLSLAHARHVQLVGIVVPLLIAGPMAVAFAAPPPGRRLWLGVGVAAGLVLLGARLAIPVARADSAVAPMAALAHVPPALRAEPVLNDYAFGGYLMFEGVHPFIDSRAELYGDAFLTQYGNVIRPDEAALAAVLQRYKIGWVIMGAANPINGLMAHRAGWCSLYQDDVAHVYARCTGP